MTKMRKRLILDGALTVLLVFEMFYQLTGDVLHEIFGIVFFAGIVAHLVLARRWAKATAQAIRSGKKMKAANTVRVVLGIMLALVMAVLLVSSVAVSNLLLGLGVDLAGSSYGTWALVHTVSSYGLCCLVTIHLAVHWVSVAGALRIAYDPSRRAAINAGVAAVAALGVFAIEAAGASALAQPAAAAGGAGGAKSGSNDTDAANPGGSNREAQPQAEESPLEGLEDIATPDNRRPGARGSKGSASPRSNGSAPNSADGSGSAIGQDDSDSAGGSGQGSNSGSSGVCTLCRKYCPLSAPRCDRPYREGLI